MALKKAEREFRAQMAAFDLRWCPGCAAFLQIGLFGRDKSRTGGMYTRCTGCEAARNVARYAANRGQIAARHAAYYRDNAGQLAARQAAYRRNNAEQVRERNAAYRREHPEVKRAAARRRRARKARVFHAPFDEQAAITSFGGLCRFCEVAPAETLEHFVPVSWGGDHAVWNCFGSCGPCNYSRGNKDPFVWMESRGIDVDTWERKHVAGHFDLPAKVFKIARVYRPPVAAWEKPDQLRLGGLFLAQGTCAALHNSRPSRLAARTHHGRATSRQGPHPSAPLVPA